MNLLRRITLLLLVLSTAIALAGCPFFTRDGAANEEAAPAEAEVAPAAAPEPEAEGEH